MSHILLPPVNETSSLDLSVCVHVYVSLCSSDVSVSVQGIKNIKNCIVTRDIKWP